ncbi:MAG TPA: S9 family peptidase [Planctomycetota bacterium]|jgi:dipeptidyl-peptidase-4|nr:S9 family peptidase [Planctomycetota bacterium]
MRTRRSTSPHSPLPIVFLLAGLGACASPAEATSPASPAPVTQARVASPAGKKLTIDALYDPPGKRVDFNGNPPSNLVWIDDEHYLWPKSDPKTKKAEWLLVEADSGKSEPFAPAAKLEAALAALPAVGAEKAKEAARSNADAWGGNPKALVFALQNVPASDDTLAAWKDLYVYTLADGKAVRATSTPDEEEELAELSPDGKSVAFVRKNDLYVVDVATGTEHRLTDDGGPKVLNGKLDWLYQEEVYGRGTWRSFWWSPDSAHVAFLRLDEEGVPLYTLVDDVESPAKVEIGPYPRSGDKNPQVRLGIAGAAGGAVEWVDLGRYAGGDFLIVDVGWSPANELAFQVQDREQSWLDLNRVAAGAKPVVTTLVHETTKAWVSVNGPPKWLADGSFLWLSERTGWIHIEHHDHDGNLIAAVTNGNWEARTLRGVDEKNGWVYFSGTERSPIGADEYRVKLDGSGLARLTQTSGTHGAQFNPSFTRFIDRWSDASTPPQLRLERADGTEVRVIDKNEVPALAEYRLSKPEFLKVPTREGFEMEAMIVKPPDFDPARRYPVIQLTYAGPHAPTVHDAWAGTRGMFVHLIAQQGIIVWECDNRSASGKGAQSEWVCAQNFGVTELADIEDGLAWLKKQPWVDGERIGISGWSFGGFITSYALTHSTSFAMGIAGGSVTDWHNYDSIYTERYMRTPEHNTEGYAKTSVVAAAKDLHGELLLIHGAIDDNVHPQNTMQLAHALQKAGKPFRMMLYPKSRHGVGDPVLVKHLQSTMLDFIEETLLRTPGG